MAPRTTSPHRLTISEANDIDVLSSLLDRVKVSGGDASNIILPVLSKGRKAGHRKESCRKENRTCIGFGGEPCEDKLQCSEENKDLFSKRVKSRCKKCQAAYARDYYNRNRDTAGPRIKESTRRSRARQALIAQGAQVSEAEAQEK